jgi:hypothetical protein
MLQQPMKEKLYALLRRFPEMTRLHSRDLTYLKKFRLS